MSQECIQDLTWWVHNVNFVNRHLTRGEPSVTLTSDSSDFAWGACFQGPSAGGPWNEREMSWHINVKELMAAFLALQSFVKE